MTRGPQEDVVTAARLELRVGNLDCEGDARKLERGLKDVPGLTEVRVYPKAAKVALAFDPAVTSAPALEGKLRELGFPAQSATGSPPALKPWRDPKVLASAASGALLAVGWVAGRAGAEAAVVWPLFLASLAVGAWFFAKEALQDLVFERRVGIELLMTVAAVVSAAMGEAGEGAMLAFLYSISEAAEGYTEGKTRAAIRALMKLAPKTALVLREGRETVVPIESLAAGDVFLVKPGQSIATDGVVVAGNSSVDQSPVTGESVPVEKNVDDPVFAGTINAEGALEVRATRTAADNTIAKLIHLVEEAQERKGKSQQWIERFGDRYSPLVLAAGVLVAAGLALTASFTWSEALARATVFVVAAAPCALVISIPITLVATLGTAARKGVLIKGGIYVEELAKITVVALDKTGTITRGRSDVTDVVAGTLAAPALLSVAAGIERRSQHPLAQAVVRRAREQGIQPAEVTDFKSLTGAGAQARLDGSSVYIGSPAMFSDRLGLSLAGVASEIERLQDQGKTVVLAGSDRDVFGLLAIRDEVRPGVQAALAAMRDAGVKKVAMLTGDNEKTARAIAASVGIDEVHADLKPEDKVERVRSLAERYGHVAMVGDGVNDAPALAAATVGVAMGAAGTDVALETADVALMGDDLANLAYAFQLAHRNRNVVRQNLALSAVVILVLVVGALAGVFSLPLAVIAHEMSEFVVIGSGLRMLRS